MATYTLISSSVLSTTAASFTFSSVPGTYTDLLLKTSTRDTYAYNALESIISFNGSTSNYKYTLLYGNGVTTFVTAALGLTPTPSISDGATATANTYSNSEIYISSYTASQSKPLSVSSVAEDNTTGVLSMYYPAGLWDDTAPITSITFTPASTYAAGSSFYLYGISNA